MDYLYTPAWQYLLSVKENTGVAEMRKRTESVEVFPNPSSDLIQINCEKGFQMFDLTGKIIKENSKKTNKIYFNDLQSGIYIIKSKEKRGRFVKY